MTQPIRISVLGGFTLEVGGANRTARVPRKLATLLGVLAISRERGIGRDRLLDLIWSDGDPERARHALTQSLYAIRRLLGDAEALIGTSQLSLNFGLVATDIEALERGMSARDHESVLEVWRGVPLEGFTTGASEAVERWLDQQRALYRQRLTSFLDHQGKALVDSGQSGEAVKLYRRRAALDATDAMGAMLLMRALAAAGDTPAALQHGSVYAHLVRRELDMDPDPAVADLVRELEQANSDVAVPQLAVQRFRRSIVSSGFVWNRLWGRWRVAYHARRTRWWRGVFRRAAFTSITVVLALLAFAHYGTVQKERAVNPHAVAVVPFRVDGLASELGFLRTGVVDLLSAALAARDTVPVTEPGRVLQVWRRDEGMRRWPSWPSTAWPMHIRRSLGSGRFVTGAVIGNSSQLIVQASLTNGTTGEVEATASVHGPLDALPNLTNRLATLLVADAAGVADAMRESPDVDPGALRRYIKALAAQRAGNDASAQSLLAAALQRDSTMAAAAVELAHVSNRMGDFEARDRALALSVRWHTRLATRERRLLATLLPSEACADSGYARLARGARLCGTARTPYD